MKKITALALALVLLVGLVACTEDLPLEVESRIDEVSVPSNIEGEYVYDSSDESDEYVDVVETQPDYVEDSQYPPEGEYTDIMASDDRYYLCRNSVAGFDVAGEYYGIYDSQTGEWAVEYMEIEPADNPTLEFISHGDGVFSFVDSLYKNRIGFMSADFCGVFLTDNVYFRDKVKFTDGEALVLMYVDGAGYIGKYLEPDVALYKIDTEGHIEEFVPEGFEDEELLYWNEGTDMMLDEGIFALQFHVRDQETDDSTEYIFVYFRDTDTYMIIDDQEYTTRITMAYGDTGTQVYYKNRNHEYIVMDDLEGEDGNEYYAVFNRNGDVVTEATPWEAGDRFDLFY